MGAAALGASSLTTSLTSPLTSSHAHTRAKPGRKQTPAVPLCSYCDRALPQEGSWMNSKRNLPRRPGAEEATRLRAACSTTHPEQGELVQLLRGLHGHGAAPASWRRCPPRARDGFVSGCVYVSARRPASVFMCVFMHVCVWLRVCGGVSGCGRVSVHIGLSANLLGKENKAGSLAAVPRAQLQRRFQTDSNRRADDRAHTLPFRPPELLRQIF